MSNLKAHYFSSNSEKSDTGGKADIDILLYTQWKHKMEYSLLKEHVSRPTLFKFSENPQAIPIYK